MRKKLLAIVSLVLLYLCAHGLFMQTGAKFFTKKNNVPAHYTFSFTSTSAANTEEMEMPTVTHLEDTTFTDTIFKIGEKDYLLETTTLMQLQNEPTVDSAFLFCAYHLQDTFCYTNYVQIHISQANKTLFSYKLSSRFWDDVFQKHNIAHVYIKNATALDFCPQDTSFVINVAFSSLFGEKIAGMVQINAKGDIIRKDFVGNCEGAPTLSQNKQVLLTCNYAINLETKKELNFYRPYPALVKLLNDSLFLAIYDLQEDYEGLNSHLFTMAGDTVFSFHFSGIQQEDAYFILHKYLKKEKKIVLFDPTVEEVFVVNLKNYDKSEVFDLNELRRFMSLPKEELKVVSFGKKSNLLLFFNEKGKIAGYYQPKRRKEL